MKNDTSGIQALKDGDNLISDNKGKAQLLNTQFMSVFTNQTSDDVPCPPPVDRDIPSIPDIEIREEGVECKSFLKTSIPIRLLAWIISLLGS